ncbi:MAG: HTTM domain-containing protein [Bacteriovoracaceae bacterium]|nr:HTTM domain-containing protein [Bacteriovoracaceae bacterium]
MKSLILKKLEEYQISPESLTIQRLALCLIIAYDFIERLSLFNWFYSDLRIVSLDLIKIEFSAWYYWSLFYLNATALWSVILFGIGFLGISITLFTNYKKLGLLIAWVILHSLQLKDWSVLTGGDMLLNILVLFHIFHPEPAQSKKIIHFYQLVLLLQIAYIYFCLNLHRSTEIWFIEASALWYTFVSSISSSLLAERLLNYPQILEWCTRFVYLTEVIAPFFAFFFYAKEKPRMYCVLIMILFHLGIAIFMNLGIFPYVCMSAWLLYLPGSFWKLIKLKFDKKKEDLRWPAHKYTSLFFAVLILLNLLTALPFPGDNEILKFQTRIKNGFYLTELTSLLGIYQSWLLYSPTPQTLDSWASVKTKENQSLFAHNLKSSSEIREHFKNLRLWNFFENYLVAHANNEKIINYSLEFFCKRSNLATGTEIQIYYQHYTHTYLKEKKYHEEILRKKICGVK